MRILKPGKMLPNEARIVCDSCECEFAATRDETVDEFTHDGVDIVVFKCPQCGDRVAVTEKRFNLQTSKP